MPIVFDIKKGEFVEVDSKTRVNYVKMPVVNSSLKKEMAIGNPGRDGADGAQGIQGIAGKDGKDGSSGSDGKDGIDGQHGADGRGIASITQDKDRALITYTDGASQSINLPAGEDGREIEMGSSSTHIRWRYVGETVWHDLVRIPKGRGGGGGASLDDLTGILVAGSNITLTPTSAGKLTLAATGAVISVSNSDGTLTMSPTTGAVSASLNLAHANTWTAKQTVAYLSSDEASVTALQSNFSRTAAQVGDDYGYAGFYGSIDDQSSISGTIEDKALQKSGFEIGAFWSGDSTVNWVDGIEDRRGYTSYVSSTGIFSGTKHDLTLTGHDITVYHGNSFTSGTHTHNVYGNKIAVASTGVVSGGTVTRNLYGQFIEVSADSNSGTLNLVGIQINSVSGGDTNWGIYSPTSVSSYLNGGIWLGPSTTARSSFRIEPGTAPTSPVDGDIWYDGTNLKMHIGGATKTFTLV